MPGSFLAFGSAQDWAPADLKKRTYDRPSNVALYLRPTKGKGLHPMASDDQQQDGCDYSMSDTFVSETRTRPYRIGFRSRRYSVRPSIKQVLALPDREFNRYLRNGCRMPHDLLDFREELLEIRRQLSDLQRQLRAMTAHNSTPTSVRPVESKGLDVDRRS